MISIRAKLNDMPYSSGLILTALPLLIFCMPWLAWSATGQLGWFIGNYCLAALYFPGILASDRLRKGREGLPLMLNFLVFFLISAFALNRDMKAALQVYRKGNEKAIPLKAVQAGGYTAQGVEAEITKLENSRSLVYHLVVCQWLP